MAQSHGWVKRYFKAFCKGFFVAVPVAVTFLDQVACVARVEGASMQPSLNPGGSQSSDVVLLNHWKVRNFEVQRGDIVSLVFPWDFCMPMLHISCGLQSAGRNWNLFFLQSACQFRVRMSHHLDLLELVLGGRERKGSSWEKPPPLACCVANICLTSQ
ncbi:mitochondrial inner membrane protease subunit 2 isoform X2 [Oryctolagus cuniculus]|uniref:mitochondrial inner membrane protease subunit 2 isoform X2 n=1 Tax=Oryctolagus cuniculus TaxID=9986 RepID=UPI002232957A|nr:mitochondrial inner membrane protease subunit 2 isoform X2 [Oryctolagus cuniculus]